MDANVVSLIGSLGFPIVACGAMAYYVKYISDKNSAQIESIMNQHREEMSDVTTAVANNTMALQKLSDLLCKKEESL